MKKLISVGKIASALSWLAIIGFFGFIYYLDYIKPNQLSQEITLATRGQEKNFLIEWEWNTADSLIHRKNKKVNSDSINRVNSYRGKIIYMLTTKMGSVEIRDFGTESEILAMKCSKAKAVKRVIEAEKQAREVIEKYEAKRDSLAEKVIERFNEKSCN